MKETFTPVLRGPGSREAAWLLGATDNWRSEDFYLARLTALSTAPLTLGVSPPAARLPYSERSASVTSTCAARAAGNVDAIVAAASNTMTEAITGHALGICRAGK